MGVAAILTSDLFRLRSTLDLHTQVALDRQRALAVKDDLSLDDIAELARIRKDLTGLGFSQTSRDPLYQLFVEAWHASADPQWTDNVQLTPEEQRARTRLANQIVQQLRSDQNSWMRHIDLSAIRHQISTEIAALDTANTRIACESNPHRRHQLLARWRRLWIALRAPFEQLSFHKCWYTESKNPGTDDDVDHYRPKSSVHEDPAHSGYYWLAFEWTNLRLSCHRANRPRIHPTTGETGGKADHFPLLNEQSRARSPHDDLSLEEPALLDPTNAEDCQLLSFSPNGEVALSPAFSGNAAAQTRLDASRLYLNLNWPCFCDARVTLYNRILRLIHRGEREAPTEVRQMVQPPRLSWTPARTWLPP